MSMNPDGSFSCDRCGTDVGNGSVVNAVVVNDLDKENPGHVRNLHFCRDRQEGEGDAAKAVKGCEHRILSPSNIKHFAEHRPDAGPGESAV